MWRRQCCDNTIYTVCQLMCFLITHLFSSLIFFQELIICCFIRYIAFAYIVSLSVFRTRWVKTKRTFTYISSFKMLIQCLAFPFDASQVRDLFSWYVFLSFVIYIFVRFPSCHSVDNIDESSFCFYFPWIATSLTNVLKIIFFGSILFSLRVSCPSFCGKTEMVSILSKSC